MRLLRLFKRDLALEAADWVAEGIVDSNQAERILGRYGTSLADAKRMSIGYWALTALAVVFAGLSLIVLVSANWDDIPRAVRMGALVGLTATVNIIGLRLFLRQREMAGILSLFFGGISYGVSIMLIAQIYHLGEHYPDGIFFWALGVLPLVFLTRSRLIALQVLILAVIWMFTEVETHFFPWTFPLFALGIGWLVIAHRPSSVLFIGAVASMVTWINFLIGWLLGDGYHFRDTEGQLALTIGLVVFLYGLAHWMVGATERLKDMGMVMSLWVIRGLLVFMVVFSFEDSWDGLHFSAPIDKMMLLVVPALGALGAWLAGRDGSVARNSTAFIATYFTGAMVLAYLHMPTGAALLTNLCLLASGIWFIRLGVAEGVTHFYYMGIGVLLVTALCRYFDLIGDYVGAALMFLVAAGILFVSARFWKKRQMVPEKGEGDDNS